jgi:hypothetical protein
MKNRCIKTIIEVIKIFNGTVDEARQTGISVDGGLRHEVRYSPRQRSRQEAPPLRQHCSTVKTF